MRQLILLILSLFLFACHLLSSSVTTDLAIEEKRIQVLKEFGITFGSTSLSDGGCKKYTTSAPSTMSLRWMLQLKVNSR